LPSKDGKELFVVGALALGGFLTGAKSPVIAG
jgi:hypothetical protein